MPSARDKTGARNGTGRRADSGGRGWRRGHSWTFAAGVAAFAALRAAWPMAEARGQDQPRAEAAARPKAGAGGGGSGQVKLLEKDDAEARRKMAEVMRAWEAKSATIKSLYIEFQQTDTIEGEKSYQKGWAMIKAPNLAVYSVSKSDPTFEEDVKLRRLVCTGDEYWQYEHAAKEIIVQTLTEEEKERVIQDGPVPFLFNFRAAEAARKYRMYLRKEQGDYYYIEVIPLDQEDRESFSQAFLQLNKTTFLPELIYLVDPNDTDRKQFKLTTVQPNSPKVDDRFFVGARLAGYELVKNPVGEERPGARRAPSREAGGGGNANAGAGAGAGGAPRRDPVRPASATGEEPRGNR